MEGTQGRGLRLTSPQGHVEGLDSWGGPCGLMSLPGSRVFWALAELGQERSSCQGGLRVLLDVGRVRYCSLGVLGRVDACSFFQGTTLEAPGGNLPAADEPMRSRGGS